MSPIRYTPTHVDGKCPPHRRILIGGLGSLRVGQMWFPMAPALTDSKRPGYTTAPVIECDRCREEVMPNPPDA